MLCRIKPKKNPYGQATGSTIEWDTMQALPKHVRRAHEETDDPEDESSDIPF